MPVYVDPHQTSIARGRKVEEIRQLLQRLEITGDLVPLENSKIFGLTEGNEVPPFIHPLTFQTRNKEVGVAVDLRPYVNSKDPTMISVSNRGEYTLQVTRAQLTYTWIHLPRKYFANVLDTTMKLFVKWVSTQIAKRYSLRPQDIVIMDIVIAVYYAYLLNDEKEIDEMGRLNLVNRISKVFKYQAGFINETILDMTSPIENVEGLCNAIKFKTQSVRLKDLNAGVLYTLISRSWFGHNAPEILAAALEHIPTFYALIYTASNESLYRKTGFTQTIDVVLKNDKLNAAQGIKNLIDLGNA